MHGIVVTVIVDSITIPYEFYSVILSYLFPLSSEYLDCSQFFTVTNNSAMLILVHVSWCTHARVYTLELLDYECPSAVLDDDKMFLKIVVLIPNCIYTVGEPLCSTASAF